MVSVLGSFLLGVSVLAVAVLVLALVSVLAVVSAGFWQALRVIANAIGVNIANFIKILCVKIAIIGVFYAFACAYMHYNCAILA